MEERTLGRVWKALADPTRRRVLDLLRQRPRTTGELSASFRVSRFAVMKHLGVLEAAGLVLVRREGRERWNHLNAVPIQRIHERWISPYQARWASSLLRLKRSVEPKEGEVDMAAKRKAEELRSVHIEQEVAIQAPPGRVYEALTRDVAAWWGAPYHISPSPKALYLEAKLGGRFYEEWGDGDGALWATVTSLKKSEHLELTGPIGSGAVQGRARFDLSARGEGTLLKLSHRMVGQIGEETATSYAGGWKDLLGVRLKAYVESGKRYGLGHEPPPGLSGPASKTRPPRGGASSRRVR